MANTSEGNAVTRAVAMAAPPSLVNDPRTAGTAIAAELFLSKPVVYRNSGELVEWDIHTVPNVVGVDAKTKFPKNETILRNG